MTYGQGIKTQERFSNLIEQRLARQNGNYEVLNFGRPGAETVDHVSVLDRLVLKADPDFILLQWYTNDVEGHDKSKRPRRLRLLPYPLHEFFLKYSALFYLMNQNWIAIQDRVGWNSPGYVEYMIERFQDAAGPSSVAANGLLKSFIQLCKERSILLGIVLFTRPYEGGSPLDFLTERVLQICTEEGIRCVDLRGTFAPYAAGGTLFANRFDRHPSSFANRLVVGKSRGLHAESSDIRSEA